MTHFHRSLVLASLLALGVSVAPVHAQQARSFVSGAIGNDANAPNCTRNAPCRTFQVAHDNTLPLGEITVLDPGSYGSVTITKGISIINDGVGEAGALVSGGALGITINAALTDNVSLRGLTIKGIGFGGGAGIVINSAEFVSIENCVVRNLTRTNAGNAIIGSGIVFQPTISGGASSLVVSNTVVSDNAVNGIWVNPSNHGFVHATFNRVESSHNGNDGVLVEASGFLSGAAIRVAVESSVASVNGNAGFENSNCGQSKAVIYMTVVRSVSEGNAFGFSGWPFCSLGVGQSTISGNAQTWVSVVESFLDNYVNGNFDGDPAPPFSMAKQ